MPNKITLRISVEGINSTIYKQSQYTFHITPVNENRYLYCIVCKKEPQYNEIGINLDKFDSNISFFHTKCLHKLHFMPLKEEYSNGT